MSVGNFNLKNMVLFSNSLPKSGSTLLYCLQREFLYGVSEKSINDDNYLLERAGVASCGGFLSNDNLDSLASYLLDNEVLDGPYVFKIHSPLTGNLQNLFFKKFNVFISLSIRDPLDMLLSAHDNYYKTGEFSSFQCLENGCKTINTWFQRIYDTCINNDNERIVPVVRYEQIVSNPMQAIYNSFDDALMRMIFYAVADKYLNLKQAYNGSSHRLGPSNNNRDSIKQSEEFLTCKKELSEFRKKLGYE